MSIFLAVLLSALLQGWNKVCLERQGDGCERSRIRVCWWVPAFPPAQDWLFMHLLRITDKCWPIFPPSHQVKMGKWKVVETTRPLWQLGRVRFAQILDRGSSLISRPDLKLHGNLGCCYYRKQFIFFQDVSWEAKFLLLFSDRCESS